MSYARNKETASGITFIIKESIKSFIRHNNFEMSVALASYGFFSIIPLLFFVIYLSGSYTAVSNQIINSIENLMAHLFPNLKIFTVRELYFPTSYKIAWGIISFSMIIVSLMSVSDSLRTAFLKVFNVTREVSFFRLQLINIASTVLILALFAALVAGEATYTFYGGPLIENSFLKQYGDISMSFIVTCVCMVMVYVAFPPVRLNIRHIVTVSVITAMLLVAMKSLFARFLTFNPDYGVAFGSMKTLFIMIIWIYYCFLVILFGAEIIANIGKRDALILKKLFLGADHTGGIPEKFINRYIKSYNEEDVIFSEEENGDVMFFVMSGSVSISRKTKVIRIMKKNDYFGEMSMLLDAPRTATAKALEQNTRLVVISRENFETILRESPEIVLAILKEMALRLKSTNESI